MLLDAIAPPHSSNGDQFHLALSADGSPAETPLTTRLAVREADGRVTIDTGSLHVSLGGSPSVLLRYARIGDADRPVLADVRLRMTVRLASLAVSVVAIGEQTRIVESGPVSVCVESNGSLVTGATGGQAVHVGRFTFRVHADAGLPTLRTSIRLYNDTKPDSFQRNVEDDPLEVTDLALVGTLPGRIRGAVTFGAADGSLVATTGTAVELRQDSADHFKVTSDATLVMEGQRAQGWIAAGGPAGWLQASTWRFWQQAPEALALEREQLTIGLFAATEAVPAYLPRYGEAKRHDIGLSFSTDMADQATMVVLGKLTDEPPRLFDGPWFCESGALDLLDPAWLRNVPELAAWVAKTYGGVTSATWATAIGGHEISAISPTRRRCAQRLLCADPGRNPLGPGLRQSARLEAQLRDGSTHRGRGYRAYPAGTRRLGRLEWDDLRDRRGPQQPQRQRPLVRVHGG